MELYEGVVKLKPEEYWTIHRHIVNRLSSLPSLVALGKTTPMIADIIVHELGWALLPPEGYFNDEEKDEYNALMSGEQAEAVAALTEWREENGLDAMNDPSEDLLSQLRQILGLDDDEALPFN